MLWDDHVLEGAWIRWVIELSKKNKIPPHVCGDDYVVNFWRMYILATVCG